MIDNIFSNDPCSHSISGLFFNDISDHLPIFSLVSGNAQSCNNPSKYITFRDKSAHNVARFRNELSDINWKEIPGFDNPSEAYGIFLSRFISIYNKCFPLKKVKANKCNFSKPWFSKGLAHSVKKKNLLYRRFLRNPCFENEAIYKKYKNKLNHSLKIAKRLYYEARLERLKSNVKGTWRLLNEILNRKKRKSSLPSIFKTDSHEFSGTKEIADQFCNFFTNIGPNLAKKIPNSDRSHQSFLPGKLVNSIFLEDVNQQEILEICNFRNMKLFAEGKIASYDNKAIDDFTKKYIVSKEHAKEYVKHLEELNTGALIRAREKERKKLLKQAKTFSDYNWKELADKGKLMSLTKLELKHYLTHYKLSCQGKKCDWAKRIESHLVVSTTSCTANTKNVNACTPNTDNANTTVPSDTDDDSADEYCSSEDEVLKFGHDTDDEDYVYFMPQRITTRSGRSATTISSVRVN